MKKQGEWIGGIWYSKDEIDKFGKLKVSNPKGYNKYKKNPKPKKKKQTYQELVAYMSQSDAITEYKKLYQKRMKLKNEILSISHKISNLHEHIFKVKE